jgi:beta-galactosidase
VYSNLDSVELFLNSKSLGAKDMKKDSHVAWVVPYAPGAIEARGSKSGQVVMKTRRETTGPATKLVMKADRQEASADGEDVVMFAVEVQDAQGRVVPITDNVVNFRVSGAGKVIGIGNGDPTDHESDKGTVRKAFCGYCMALVQSAKTAGSITVEAGSLGLTSASLTIATKEMALRPQVGTWKREVPMGSGITGLWRPIAGSGGAMLFTLRQDGNMLTGSIEGAGGGFFGGSDAGIPITDGKVDGQNVYFKAGNNAYSGTSEGDQIELQRTVELGVASPRAEEPTGPRPAVGPPPDGSDPSRSPNSRVPSSVPVVLHRVER